MSSLKRFALIFLLGSTLFLVDARSKRSLNSLGEVIRTYTGRNALDYNNYGCWCGLGGSGTPKDAVDRCCQAHDRCYDRTSCILPEQAVLVKQSCSGGSCRCNDKAGSCPHQACTCDVQFGQCIRNAPYNPKYKGKC